MATAWSPVNFLLSKEEFCSTFKYAFVLLTPYLGWIHEEKAFSAGPGPKSWKIRSHSTCDGCLPGLRWRRCPLRHLRALGRGSPGSGLPPWGSGCWGPQVVAGGMGWWGGGLAVPLRGVHHSGWVQRSGHQPLGVGGKPRPSRAGPSAMSAHLVRCSPSLTLLYEAVLVVFTLFNQEARGTSLTVVLGLLKLNCP